MNLPSLVRSLSEVAFSEPARSIKLCAFINRASSKVLNSTYQDGRLDTLATLSLQPSPPGCRWPKTWCCPATWRTFPFSTLTTLNNDSEHAVTSTTSLIPVRTCSPPISLPALKDLSHILQACDYLLPQRSKNHICARTMQLYRLGSSSGGRSEQIMDSFVVDFQVRAAQKVLARRSTFDISKYVFHCPWYDTRFSFVT